MKDPPPPQPKAELDQYEPPMKKLRTGVDSSSPTSPPQDVQEDEYEASLSEKRKHRKSSAATNKGKGKAKAQLDTLFGKLPTDVIYMPSPSQRSPPTRQNKSHASFAPYSSASIWREAREEVDPPVPNCPPDQSEPQWAHLLFSRDCSTCMRSNIPNVDWYHRLRLCSKCGRAGVVLILGPRAQKAFPGIPDVNMLLELLPSSNTGSSDRGKYYRMKDIADIGAEWAIVKKKGSRADIQEFKDRKKSETGEIMTHGAFCKTWERDRSILKKQQAKEIDDARRNEIYKRLEALGYNSQDVRDWRVTKSRHFDTSTPLTEQRWKIIRRRLEPLVNEVKTQRLAVERPPIIKQRETVAENLIKSYYTTLDVASAFRPRPQDLFQTEPFRAIIDLPNEITVTAAEFQPAMDALLELVSNGARETQSILLQCMIDGGATNIDSPITPSDFGKLELATSTFFCKSSSNYNGLPVCGGEDITSHRCYTFPASAPSHQCLSYDHRASNAVIALITAANLDLNTTADQMDQLDLRFHCPSLPDELHRLAMSWRDAAFYVRRFDQLQPDLWEVLSSEETAAVKQKEKANIGDIRFRFRCNICVDSSWIRRRDVENHLRGW
ncbi:hypothetical protein M407DRAFT_26536 [Tulasnella calospora MUT 4182]|uniref:Uncharacterized protein n=1 Tax=Tulasnella calospora MUT 4182 TaxID=1051891 RepID=A0A0C3Q4Q8_9AGAM|nr:hypothetical protein M407DRAFT_26536 [Tulasnella calospora MUT 4182]